MTTVEQAMCGLFTQLTAASQEDGITPAFITTGRRLKLWNDVSAEHKPALFLIETHEQHTPQPPQGAPSKVLIKAAAIIYTATNNPEAVPATQLNNAIESIKAQLLPDDFGRNVYTIGGLAYRCWIEGQLVKVPGDMDGLGMAIVPVNILLVG